MSDTPMYEHINDLAAEEESLYSKAGDGSGLDEPELARLETIKIELDRCYDLLHQRQALRSAGRDPDEAELRSPGVVENYQQ